MTQFKKGDVVRQIMPAPIQGTVDGYSVCQETGRVLVLVGTVDAAGSPLETYFDAAQLEVVTPG